MCNEANAVYNTVKLHLADGVICLPQQPLRLADRHVAIVVYKHPLRARAVHPTEAVPERLKLAFRPQSVEVT